jgi:uncharacterized protein YaiL (DUF2058 family)
MGSIKRMIVMQEVIEQVANMFKDQVILHCDKCDHEQTECLGKRCDWCGGNMLPIQKET